MPITSAVVTTNLSEYCKYDYDKNTIVITATSPAGQLTIGTSLVFSVRRRPSVGWPDEHQTLMQKTVVATSADATANALSASFVLGTEDVDADGISRAIHGQYDVRVALASSVNTYWQTPVPIAISIVSVKELRTDWCYGASLRSSEVVKVKYQPKLVTGVTVTEVSQDTFVGPKNLVLTHTYLQSIRAWTLTWDNGDPTPIVAETTGEYVLTDMGAINYILVNVNALLLPNSTITERLLIVQDEMSDEMIARRIKNALNSVESQLGFPIEPYLYTTMPIYPGQLREHNHQTDHYDRISRAVDYVVPSDGFAWPSFRMPQQWCIKIHRLYGFHSVDKIVEIEGDWWNNTIDRMSSFVTLVPALASFARWTVFTHPMLAPFYMHRNIPGFWQYDATFGLPDLKDNDRSLVRELLARTAAVSILIDAQRAYQGGLGSESTSRDGISTSRSFNPGGPYGPTIQAHMQWMMVETPRIKTKLGGILFGMLGTS